MRLARILRQRLRSIFRRSQVERELEQELAIHLEQIAREYRAAGLSEDEARFAAHRAFGGAAVAAEQCRDARRLRLLEDLGKDLIYAFRLLAKSPGFTATVVLSLALGIGANTAIFGVIDALMLRKLPVRSPEQLVTFGPRDFAIDYRLLERLRTLTPAFEGISASVITDLFNTTIGPDTSGLDGGPTSVYLVTGNYFALMGINPATGRLISDADDRPPEGQAVAVISYDYWEHRLGRAPDAVGRILRMNGAAFTIVGVAPRGFLGDRAGRPADVWIPVMMEPHVMPGCRVLRCGAEVRIIGRLKPGVTIQQAQAAAGAVAEQFNKEEYPTQRGPRQLLQLQPATRGYAPQLDSLEQSLTILMVGVGLVLLIACANIANLLLVRSAARLREMAVRLAIGASTARIVRQLLTESIVLAAIGGALGSLFAFWGMRVLASALSSGQATLALESRIALYVHVDGRILAFAGALCLLTGVLSGLVPARRSSQISLSAMLAGRGAASSPSAGHFRLGNILVVSQVALSLVILVGAALAVRTLRNLRQTDLGVDREHVLLVWTMPVQTGRLGISLAELWRTVQTRLSRLPGVLSVGASNGGVLAGDDRGGPSEVMRIQGQTPKPGMLVGWRVAAPLFFESAGIRLISGRTFTEQDDEKSPRVAVVNETMARFYFGGENPIGRRFAKPLDAGYPWEIVGVVEDAKDGTPRGRRAQFFFPYRQDMGHLQLMCVALRAAVRPSSMAPAVRKELRDLDPTLPVTRIDTVEEQLDDVLAQERVTAELSGFFSAVSLFLACLGLYGVVSYAVARRTNEIGIRMALGAGRGDVLNLVLQQSLTLVLVGTVVGVPLALMATRLIANRLFGVSASDPITIGGVVVLLSVMATLAALLPARRAARVDPLVALRHD